MAASAADLSAGVLGMFAGLEDDERLAGQGLAEAFAEVTTGIRPYARCHFYMTTS